MFFYFFSLKNPSDKYHKMRSKYFHFTCEEKYEKFFIAKIFLVKAKELEVLSDVSLSTSKRFHFLLPSHRKVFSLSISLHAILQHGVLLGRRRILYDAI